MVKIYVMTHKKFNKPEDDIYIPMHVGKATASEDFGYLGDDSGDNISDLNCYYGELTGLYWIWKQETQADIVGICHYRRYFLNGEGAFLTRKEYETALKDHDVMLSDFIFSAEHNNWVNFVSAHNEKDLKAVALAIQKLYPSDYPAFCQVMADTKCCYANLMATTLEKFKEYCTWLFSIFDEAWHHMDVDGYDAYQKRVFGFLSESLLYVWAAARKYRIYEGKIGVIGEKAETMELKRTMEQLIADGDVLSAKKFFYKTIELRPDICLELSDISGEIPIIEKLLYIMHEEGNLNETGLLDMSRDLTVLIEHYRNTYRLIRQYGKEALVKAKAYFDAYHISSTAFHIIEQDANHTLSLYNYLNEGELHKKVTLIALCQNYNDTMSASMANLLYQTLQEIEIIFIDTGLEAEGKYLLKECVQRYPKKVRVWTAQEWNASQKNFNSSYLLFVRTQDLSDVTLCEKLYEAAENNHWLLTGRKYIDNQDGNIHFMLDASKGSSQENSHICFLTDQQKPWGILLHKDLWHKHRVSAQTTENLIDMEHFVSSLLETEADIASGNIEAIVYKYCN